jgi:hypothetical protein
VLGGVFFFEFLTPLLLGSCNFLNSNTFLMIFSVLHVSIGGVQVLMDIRNNGALSLRIRLAFEHLK